MQNDAKPEMNYSEWLIKGEIPQAKSKLYLGERVLNLGKEKK